jgi:hypothetical protein
VLRIRIGFNVDTDPDPAVHLNVEKSKNMMKIFFSKRLDPDLQPPSPPQTSSDVRNHLISPLLAFSECEWVGSKTAN